MRQATIIIRTLAAAHRRDLLLRAIRSIHDQDGIEALALIVVNGTAYDPSLIDSLRNLDRVDVVSMPEAHVARAIEAGRAAVKTEYFGFLDDDDVLLPGTLKLRVEALSARQADVLVSSGLRESGAIVCPDGGPIERDPLGALLQENWLASCAALYRASSVPLEIFKDGPRFCEWTLIAFKLAVAGLKIAYSEVPAFCISDTPGSESKKRTTEMIDGEVSALAYMYRHAEPRYRRAIREKLASALHNASDHFRHSQPGLAWRYHIRSLMHGGWAYLPYTAHLVVPILRPGTSMSGR